MLLRSGMWWIGDAEANRRVVLLPRSGMWWAGDAEANQRAVLYYCSVPACGGSGMLGPINGQ